MKPVGHSFSFDSLDLKQARDRKPREIRWDELDASELSPAERTSIGEEWRARMVQEHLAVGAFATGAARSSSMRCPRCSSARWGT
jgi:hypothetical protein